MLDGACLYHRRDAGPWSSRLLAAQRFFEVQAASIFGGFLEVPRCGFLPLEFRSSVAARPSGEPKLECGKYLWRAEARDCGTYLWSCGKKLGGGKNLMEPKLEVTPLPALCRGSGRSEIARLGTFLACGCFTNSFRSSLMSVLTFVNSISYVAHSFPHKLLAR